ncbi:MAG TPA: enoyl-CoA hydratase/isomerase family protein [Caulobacteraceae bacterium]|jgi:enoyl-CoA hydratase/carnithine racemase
MSAKLPASQTNDQGVSDQIVLDLVDLGGAGLVVTDLDGPSVTVPNNSAGAVRVGVSRAGRLPPGDLEAYDILLCGDPAAARPWVGVAPEHLEATISLLRTQVDRQPVAAAVAAQILRMTLKLGFAEALLLESLGYSMLLASQGFRAWRASNPARQRAEGGDPRVQVSVEGDILAIELNRPAARNAFDARMRDELVAALEFAAAHPDAPQVVLGGRGAAFSAGGDLDEFGRADDVGRAHLIRSLRSPARLVHDLGDRITAKTHGACIGAGVEVAAAAGRVTARPGAFFRLPEVSMGLIPGAGGTASIPRRIGRRRACFMAISGADIDRETALAWGLIDALEPTA